MNLPDGMTLWDWAYLDNVSYESQLDKEGNYIGPVLFDKQTNEEKDYDYYNE